MSISLMSVVIRHERRVRLAFDAAVGSGAYVASLYDCVSDGQDAGDPGVVKVFAVANSPNFVELQLGADMQPGKRYRFFANGVPAAGSGVTPTPSSVNAQFMISSAVLQDIAPNANPVGVLLSDIEEVLFGKDLRHDGVDFAEDANGDILVVSGLEVLDTDNSTAIESDGLAWDPNYGAKLRQRVDAPSATVYGLRGIVIAALRKDDRNADVAVSVNASDPARPYLETTVTPIGLGLARKLPPITARGG